MYRSIIHQSNHSPIHTLAHRWCHSYPCGNLTQWYDDMWKGGINPANIEQPDPKPACKTDHSYSPYTLMQPLKAGKDNTYAMSLYDDIQILRWYTVSNHNNDVITTYCPALTEIWGFFQTYLIANLLSMTTWFLQFKKHPEIFKMVQRVLKVHLLIPCSSPTSCMLIEHVNNISHVNVLTGQCSHDNEPCLVKMPSHRPTR